MKKIFAIAAIAAATVCGTANAEGLYVGGSLGYMHNEHKGTETNGFNILPEIGYNLNSKWAIGTTIGYEFLHVNGGYNSNMFEFNPYARYTYFRTSNNLVQLFVDGGAGIGLGWTNVTGDDHTSVIWNVGFRPGIALNFTEKFSMVAHVGFLGYKGANNAAYDAGYDRQGGIWFDNNDLTLGFYYNF